MAPVIGIQTPRFEHVPSYTTSSGDEAIELAALTGLVLDPWQRYALRHAMGERIVPHPVTQELGVRWAAFEMGLVVSRQNGKGSLIEARQLAGLFLLGEGLQLYSAHEFKTAEEAFIRVRNLIEDTDELRRQINRPITAHGQESITLRNGGPRLRFVARTGGSGRGFSGDTIYLDEAFNLPSQAVAAMLPIVSRRENPQIWYTSSAGWEISRVLANVRRRALKLIANPDPASRLLYLEWSADEEAWFRSDPEEFVRDRRNWAIANPGLNIQEKALTEMGILAELEAMSEDLALFARERLGIGMWPEDTHGWNVIPEDAWTAMADPDAQPTGRLALAVDVTPDRKRGCIAVAGDHDAPGARPGERVVEIIEHRAGTEWIPQRIGDLLKKHREITQVVVSPRGPAGALLPLIRDALGRIRRANVLRESSSQEEAQACQAFYDGVIHAKTVVHRGDLRMSAGLAGARKKDNPEAGTWHWSRRNPSTDLSPVWAATLAVWGHSVAPKRHASWAEYS
jgi:hypothetical protein